MAKVNVSQGRKVLGLIVPHSVDRTHCSHWDLGRSDGVCGEVWRGSTRDTLLGVLSHQVIQRSVAAGATDGA